MDSCDKIQCEISALSEKIVRICGEMGVSVSTAESITGGLIAGAITSISGSSSVIEMGLCAYSNAIKMKVLNVQTQTIEKYSEYSLHCASEMAIGAAKLSLSDYSVSTSGIAGPSGATADDSVGTVYIAVYSKSDGKVFAQRFIFPRSHGFDYTERDYIRAQAVRKALKLLLEKIQSDQDKELRRRIDYGELL